MTDTTLRHKVMQAIYWSLAAKIAIQIFSWGVTFFVIRLLDPADYGLAAMSDVIFAFLFMLTAEGMFSAIVRSREIDDRKLRQMFGVLLLINTALFLAQYFSAPLLARYYHEPRIVEVLQLHAVAFLFIPFTAIPSSLLDRALDIRRRALVETGTQVASGVLVLTLALMEFGVWALIWGVVSRFAFRAVLLNIAAPWLRPPIFSLRGIESMVWFGGFMTLNHVIWSIYTRVDVFLGGHSLSAKELGYYTVAAHLASLPMAKVVQMLNEIAFPAYATIQDQYHLVRRHLRKSLRLVALVTLPMFLGLAAVADEFIAAVFGPAWEPAVFPLQIFCLVMPFQSITALVEAPLAAMGHAKTRLTNNLIALSIMPPAFFIGIEWGILGLCLAWLVAYPIAWYLMLRRSLRVLQVEWADCLNAVFAPLLTSAIMLAAILLISPSLEPLPTWARLLAHVGVGVGVYGTLLIAFCRGRLEEAITLARSRD